MGTLHHFNLAAMRKIYGLKSFVETGTGEGMGVRLAVAAGFERIYSIECVHSLAVDVAAKFAHVPSVHIHSGQSVELLPGIIDLMPPGPALFWLDAHFPGADHAGAEYDAEQDVDRRLPLEREVELISRLREGCRDLVFIDDARIYQPGPYGAGDLPLDWAGLRGVERKGLDFVRNAFGRTHGVVVDYADQGYVMVSPHVQ